jgi:uncharacterized SAM-binding protein YcdF (DUF218 family)
LLFVLSKIFWDLTRPDLLLPVILGIGLALVALHWRRIGWWITAVTAFLLLAIALLPTDDLLMAPLENRFPPPRSMPTRVDGIIALGGVIDAERSASHGIPSIDSEAERLTTLVKLARLYPSAKLVFTSGSASLFGDRPREADAAKSLLADLGMDTTKIIFERESRNTVENAIFSKRLAEPKPGEIWILITSAWHMPRAVGIFRQAGWPVLPWPVAYKAGGGYEPGLVNHLADLDRAAHEWVGLVAYRLLDRTDALFPAP